MIDIFDIQSDVARQIASALEAKLSLEENDLINRKPTEDLEAYDLYLLGQYHRTKRSDEGIRRGIEYLEEAVRRDPMFSRAVSAMAEAYLFAAIGYASIPHREALSKAMTLASDALAMDDSLADAHATLGLATLIGAWKPYEALASVDRALALVSSSTIAHQWSAYCHSTLGDHVAALDAWNRAVKLDPMSPGLITESGWPLTFVGLYAEARVRYLRALELEPNFGLAQFNVGLTYDREGNAQEAIKWYERAVQSSDGMAFIKGHLGALYARMGENERAEAILDEVRMAASGGYPASLPVALVEEALGNTEAALDALESAFHTHEPLLAWIANPGFIPFERLRMIPRFEALLKQIGFPEPDLAAERSRVERWLEAGGGL